MNATDQEKLCKDGYIILRRIDSPYPHIRCKNAQHPTHWRRFGRYYTSKSERDRSMKEFLTAAKIIED